MRFVMTLLAIVICVPGARAQSGGAQAAHQVLFYPSGKLRIEAYIYKPEGNGPFPVVIYNHGSREGHEREERPFAFVGEMLSGGSEQRLSSGAEAHFEEARYAGAVSPRLLKRSEEWDEGATLEAIWLRSGQEAPTPNTHEETRYVVIVPERRGYGRSEGAPFSEEIGRDKGPRYVNRLQQEADDVIAAAEFAKTLPYVDGTRIGVMGWSFGGIVSVLAASRSPLFRAVVDQAGGALSWDGSPALQSALREAAGQIRVPLLGLVAKNDRTTESVKTVVKEAEKHGRNAQLIVYPAFTPRERSEIAPGHMIFSVQGAHLWEGNVKEFLARYLAAGN